MSDNFSIQSIEITFPGSVPVKVEDGKWFLVTYCHKVDSSLGFRHWLKATSKTAAEKMAKDKLKKLNARCVAMVTSRRQKTAESYQKAMDRKKQKIDELL